MKLNKVFMQSNEMDRIIFTPSAGAELVSLLEGMSPGDVFVLADGNTARFLPRLFGKEWLEKGMLTPLPPGEQAKTPATVATLWTELHRRQARRSSLLVNVGGGVVSDTGGFAAATFKRGMRCVNVPTTLLAQVDASVGGKTGVNFLGCKNEVGVFAPPEQVIISPEFLPSLPKRELLSGLAEMVKHALLDNAAHLRRVVSADLRAVGSPAFLQLIRNSVTVKAAIVSRDPEERGERRALNLGHTAGHAIEAFSWETGNRLLHGEAVAWGLVAELWLSVRETGFPHPAFEEVHDFVRQHYPPFSCAGAEKKVLALMNHDKKNDHPGVNFTLLENIGKYTINNYCSPVLILEALRAI